MLPTWGLILVGQLWHESDFTRDKTSRLSNENVLKGEHLMKKKILVLLVVLLLLAVSIQVASATPPPDDPDNLGACNMGAAVWVPDIFKTGGGS